MITHTTGTNKMEAKVWKKHYEVEISVDDLLALTEYETEEGDYLNEEMERVTCANDVDYNGHFGEYIFFSLATADESKDEMQGILDIIAEYIVTANTWKKNRG
jgi:hypothetical protein